MRVSGESAESVESVERQPRDGCETDEARPLFRFAFQGKFLEYDRIVREI